MKLLKKLYDKSEIIFAVAFIITYCVLMSLGDALSEAVGIQKSVTLPIGLLLSVLLLAFFKKHRLFSTYGICSSKVSAREMLFYVPAILILTANLWYGVTLNLPTVESVLYVLSMLCVGLLEEVIFRGLLFNAMKKDSERAAIIVSSVTFGIGHIINLINGSGAELVPNLLQVVYATAAGFMFVMIYVKSKSLVACITIHSVFNALSVFANEAAMTVKDRIISCILLTLISGGYAIYLVLTVKNSTRS